MSKGRNKKKLPRTILVHTSTLHQRKKNLNHSLTLTNKKDIVIG